MKMVLDQIDTDEGKEEGSAYASWAAYLAPGQ